MGNGTRGFRAPEAVMHCESQGPIQDMFSAGVMLLCIMTAHYPFFVGHTECVALLELGRLFGKSRIAEAAKGLGMF